MNKKNERTIQIREHPREVHQIVGDLFPLFFIPSFPVFSPISWISRVRSLSSLHSASSHTHPLSM